MTCLPRLEKYAYWHWLTVVAYGRVNFLSLVNFLDYNFSIFCSFFFPCLHHEVHRLNLWSDRALGDTVTWAERLELNTTEVIHTSDIIIWPLKVTRVSVDLAGSSFIARRLLWLTIISRKQRRHIHKQTRF